MVVISWLDSAGIGSRSLQLVGQIVNQPDGFGVFSHSEAHRAAVSVGPDPAPARASTRRGVDAVVFCSVRLDGLR